MVPAHELTKSENTVLINQRNDWWPRQLSGILYNYYGAILEANGRHENGRR
jgi:hypothetical protein